MKLTYSNENMKTHKQKGVMEPLTIDDKRKEFISKGQKMQRMSYQVRTIKEVDMWLNSENETKFIRSGLRVIQGLDSV